MEPKKILKGLQKHMEYTDAEMEIFCSDPANVAEVIDSHGCHCKHRVGDKFVMTAGGQLLTDQCPKGICLSALAPISRIMPTIYDRLISGSDPNFERSNVVQCEDVGLDKGGWGKILMKVYVEKFSE